MAQINDTDPSMGGGDWFDQQGPPPATGGGATADQVAALYQQLLGRAPENDQVVQQWIQGAGGDLNAIKQGIAATDEGKAFAAKSAGGANTGGAAGGPPTLNRSDPASVSAYVNYYASQPGANPSLKNDPNYWIGKISSGELGSDPNYIVSKFMTPEGAPAGQNPYGALGVANPSAGFGAPPAPYQSNPNAPTAPDVPTPPPALANPYTPATWTGGPAPTAPTLAAVGPAPTLEQFDTPTPTLTPFTAPTQAELEASPGYKERLAMGLLANNRSAAAHGTVLNGGTQQALNRYGQNFASNEYSNLFGQDLTANTTNNNLLEQGFSNALTRNSTRNNILQTGFGNDVTRTNTNNNALQTGFADATSAYDTNLNQFNTANQLGFAARQQNQNEFQQNVVGPTQTAFTNRYASYLNDNARTLNDYLTNYNIQHTADSDYWGRLKDVSSSGLTAAINDKAA